MKKEKKKKMEQPLLIEGLEVFRRVEKKEDQIEIYKKNKFSRKWELFGDENGTTFVPLTQNFTKFVLTNNSRKRTKQFKILVGNKETITGEVPKKSNFEYILKFESDTIDIEFGRKKASFRDNSSSLVTSQASSSSESVEILNVKVRVLKESGKELAVVDFAKENDTKSVVFRNGKRYKLQFLNEGYERKNFIMVVYTFSHSAGKLSDTEQFVSIAAKSEKTVEIPIEEGDLYIKKILIRTDNHQKLMETTIDVKLHPKDVKILVEGVMSNVLRGKSHNYEITLKPRFRSFEPFRLWKGNYTFETNAPNIDINLFNHGISAADVYFTPVEPLTIKDIVPSSVVKMFNEIPVVRIKAGEMYPAFFTIKLPTKPEKATYKLVIAFETVGLRSRLSTNSSQFTNVFTLTFDYDKSGFAQQTFQQPPLIALKKNPKK